MFRWVRIAAVGVVILAFVGLGIAVGLFLVANAGWIPVAVPPWLTGIFGDPALEVWLPALLAGWLLAAIATATLLAWSMFYVWRRRQYEQLVRRLERELAELRNLPFTNPAPLEDLPEEPDPAAARLLASADADPDGGDEDG